MTHGQPRMVSWSPASSNWNMRNPYSRLKLVASPFKPTCCLNSREATSMKISWPRVLATSPMANHSFVSSLTSSSGSSMTYGKRWVNTSTMFGEGSVKTNFDRPVRGFFEVMCPWSIVFDVPPTFLMLLAIPTIDGGFCTSHSHQRSHTERNMHESPST